MDQRSISGGHAIPFSRDSVDAFQDMTAFTPPSGSWLTRYPKNTSTTSNNNTNYTQTSKQEIEKQTFNSNKKKTFTVPEANQLDDPCKRYIESSEIPVKSNKSLGTDDHFKSAVCSKNLLKVCEKLMTNKEFLASTNDSAASDDDFDAELSLMNEQSRMEYYRKKHRIRRDSLSLPSSPKMDRKSQAPVSHNPYFTITKQEEQKSDTSISFLTNLFGITARNPKEAQANLAQKYEATNNNSNQNSNSSNMNSSVFNGGGGRQQEEQTGRQMTPRPHPYREMNIFSPTSM